MGKSSKYKKLLPAKRRTLIVFLVIFSLALSGTLLAEQYFTQEIEQFVLGVQTEN